MAFVQHSLRDTLRTLSRPSGATCQRFLLVLIGLCALTAMLPAAAAYPERSIRMVVAYPPGGSGDFIGRTLADSMAKIMGQSVVVENIPGASGGIGTQRVIAAAPDGYTIQMANMTEVMLNSLITPDLPYDVEKGLAPVAYIGSLPSMLIGRKTLAANTLPELLAQMRSSQKPVTAGTVGAGTPQHLALELIRAKAGVPMLPVHYKGGGPALTDLIGGHVDIAMVTIITALPHIKANSFKAFAVTSGSRSPLTPDVPAVSEVQGLSGFDIASWFGVYAPAQTPAPILKQLQEAVLKVLNDREVRGKLEQQGLSVTPADAQTLARKRRDDLQTLQPVIKAAGIKPAN